MTIRLFFVDHYGETWQSTNPSQAVIRRAFKNALRPESPYAVLLTRRN